MGANTFETIRYEKEAGTGLITLHRPDQRNALNEQMLKELRSAFALAGADTDILTVVLTSSGSDVFCAGADLKQTGLGRDGQYEHQLRTGYHPLIRGIVRLSKPVIGAVNGDVVGAGLGLVLACDYIVAADRSRWNMAFMRIGLVPDTGVMAFVTRRMGRQRAFEWAARATAPGSEELFRWGLVNKVVPIDEVRDQALETALDFQKMPRRALGLLKQLSHAADEMTLDELLDLECHLQERAAGSPDHMEGIHAFLEKRSPKFGGQGAS